MLRKKFVDTQIVIDEAIVPLVWLSFFVLLIFLFSSSTLLKFIALFILGTTLFIFRNPERHTLELDKNAIISVADGVVESIKEDNGNDFFAKGSYKVVISRSLFNTPALRAPHSSKTKLSRSVHGLHLPLKSLKSDYLNAYGSIQFCRGLKKCLAVKHTCGLFSMKLFFKEPQELEVGQRYGFILGGKVEVYIPLSARLAVKKGDHVIAAESLLAYFPA